MLLKNKTNEGKSHFIGNKRIVFQANQSKDLSPAIANFLLAEFAHEIEVGIVQTEQLIIDGPSIQENQTLLVEEEVKTTRRKRTPKAEQ